MLLFRRRLTLAAAAALAVAAAGCNKDAGKEADPSAGEAGEDDTAGAANAAGEADSPDDSGEAAGGDAPEVRPPKAEDLATYTEDLEGKGPLMATLETSMGTIHCRLFADKVPMTVANFVGLARGMKPWTDPETGEVVNRPLYDDTVFHRVIPEFMIQGGDPLGVGRGGPGYQFDNEIVDGLVHDKPGTLSMANAGPDTNGSQFYITEVPQPRLDGNYTVFGRCKEVGVVKKIARVDKTKEGGSKPKEDVTLEKVTISRGKPNK